MLSKVLNLKSHCWSPIFTPRYIYFTRLKAKRNLISISTFFKFKSNFKSPANNYLHAPLDYVSCLTWQHYLLFCQRSFDRLFSSGRRRQQSDDVTTENKLFHTYQNIILIQTNSQEINKHIGYLIKIVSSFVIVF